MNESSRGEAAPGPQEPGGDPPISGGFPPPPHPKEEFPTPPSSAQGQTGDLQLGAFGQEDLGESSPVMENQEVTLSFVFQMIWIRISGVTGSRCPGCWAATARPPPRLGSGRG